MEPAAPATRPMCQHGPFVLILSPKLLWQRKSMGPISPSVPAAELQASLLQTLLKNLRGTAPGLTSVRHLSDPTPSRTRPLLQKLTAPRLSPRCQAESLVDGDPPQADLAKIQITAP